jgi:hypothetical protein
MHPGIDADPAANAGRAPRPDVDGSFGFPPGGFKASGKAAPPKNPAGNVPWDSVFDFFRNAAEGLRDGVNLRERVDEIATVDTTVNTRTLKISISLPLAGLDDLLDRFGDERIDEIATILSVIFRNEFAATMSSMDIEDED